ncbi:fimbrial protein [Pantoea ananatis]|uniref:fimbrial protein n=1 Tax=Pantoea ananas TaxID=553 RepID=UPI003D1556A9
MAMYCKNNDTGASVDGSSNGATVSVYVNLTPSIGVNQNLIVDLSGKISCFNQNPGLGIDWLYVSSVSSLASAITTPGGTGTLGYNGSSYTLPLNSDTSWIGYSGGNWAPWPAQLYVSPIAGAGGVAIKSGDLIARLVMKKQWIYNTGVYQPVITWYWNIYANNDVVIPLGGCDVSSRNITVTLPNYPGTSTSTPIGLTVNCPSGTHNVAYYLTGTTTGTGNNIFSNTASGTAAQNIGVQISNSNGPVATNQNVSLGAVGTSPVNLGLSADYIRTGGQVVAGDVQAVVGVTFLYQ